MGLGRPTPLSRLAKPESSWVVLWIYVAAVFMSALLLFAVQPMFTRMVLPHLGGSPSVWSVAMVFFQIMLLAGYAYAHVLATLTRPAIALTVHLTLLGAAAFTLPFAIAQGWDKAPASGEALWLLGLFAASIGLPFFALSANNPLLQAWFSRTGHRDASNPYFLYAASNTGSFLALLSYPIIVEPVLLLRSQLSVWAIGFYLLLALIAGCGFLALRISSATPTATADDDTSAVAPSWMEVGRWILLSAVPSGLLIAVTAHISTDVAAAPLLWVIPLSLYLLTWILVFQNHSLIPHRWILRLEPFAIAALVALFALGADQNLILTLGVHLASFFIVTMACHGELAIRRPHPRYLTGFYLALSFGGMVGGVFAGLVAPYVFSWIAEYPILIVLAVLCRPASRVTWNVFDRFVWIMAVLAAALLVPGLAFGWEPPAPVSQAIGWVAIMIAVIAVLFLHDARKLALAVAIALALTRVYPFEAGRFETVRSFFGVSKIQETSDRQYRVLMHGTTIHGAQQIRDASGQLLQGRPKPLTYYHDEAPMAHTLAALRQRKGRPLKVAAIGLGAGSLACHIQKGEAWRFFEIDPDVARIARDPRRFTFVQSCAPDVPIILGDARLTLAQEPDAQFDLIVVDAFSSDSIPVHLLTREAMAIYKAKLELNGVVLMHVSNRHLELASVVAGIAAANGLITWVNQDEANEALDGQTYFPQA